jgi:hypothetical protein
VVITSVYNLGWLPGATYVPVEPLPIREGVELLASLIGQHRVKQELEAAFRLVALCDQLPLTIRAMGQRLAAHSHWSLRMLLNRLIDQPGWLAELGAADLDVQHLVEPSYRRLTDSDRRSFLLLGSDGRQTFTADGAAKLLKADHTVVDQLLDRLVSVNMIQREAARVAVRYRIPRMLRLFAWKCAGQT